MAEIAIRAENLSKRYRINSGRRNAQSKTLREDLSAGFRALFNRQIGVGRSRREDFWALKDVGFEIKEGARVGVIGANGAGKSTLLKVLSRIVAPTTGYAAVRGRLAALLEVGTGFHPELSGRENIYLNGTLLGMSNTEIRRAFDAIVDFAGIETFLEEPVKRYSSGMYTRLAFSVAAHLEPDILIVDEVLAVGDAAFQRKCIDRMKTLNETGRTLISVSHNMSLVASLCDSAIVLKAGEIYYPLGSVDGAIIAYNRSIADRGQESNLDRPSEGAGKLRVVSVFCGSTPDAADATVQSGQSLYIIVNATATDSSVVGTSFEIAVSFVNSYGHLVGFSDSSYWKLPLETTLDGTSFLFKVDSFLFGPGSYHLNVAITRDGFLEDVAYHAVFFTIMTGEVAGATMHVPAGIECELTPLALLDARRTIRDSASTGAQTELAR